MTLPKTYKQAVFKEQGAPLTLEDVELKHPGPGEVLVKVEACGVCHSDMFAQLNFFGAGFPIAPGHEIIGRVAEVGDGVAGWNIGDRVGAGWHGGHDDAEYAVIRSEAASRIPENVDAAKYAPILCAGVTVFNGIRHMDIGPGELVAIQGVGGLGHLAIQYANRMGYRVAAISRGSSKEEFARKLGAHEYIDTEKNPDVGAALQALGGAKLIVSMSPTGQGMTDLLKGLGILGKLLILSVPGDISINTAVLAIQFTELQNIDCMIEKFPLAKANEAYKVMMDGSVRFRAVITMD
ncbi:hypothetical protein VSDG_06270 [Cytospora chrysosperma]|uniref:Enoyl reductase (ER) domain-containing protein n=1 Tax=Cytospora chrysosperma TaxID=252740 RepID=A0A423VSD9_CYTCH|nr:hypothetical protein VSDG_06270 [Valsa sordida]